MTRRTRSVVAAAALAVGLISAAVVVPETARAGTATPRTWCSEGPAPCIQYVKVGGATYISTPPDFYVNFDDLGDGYFLWLSGLDPADESRVFEIKLDLASYSPRYIQARAAKGLTADRQIAGDGSHHVTFVGSPTVVVGNCDATCVSSGVATDESETFNASINDMSTSGGTPEEIKTWYGTDNFSNVWSVTPAQVDYNGDGDPYVHTELENPHYHADGVTVFKGYAHLTIPPAALKYWFYVDDPSSLTSSSMIGTSPTGTVDVSVGSDGSLLVDVANMTFTKRSVRVKAGTLVPRRPTNVASHRVTSTRGKVTYGKAQSRGSRVRSYVAKCVAADGSRSKFGTADATERRVIVRQLRAGVAYDCKVKAKSRAGASRWSAGDRMPRRP